MPQDPMEQVDAPRPTKEVLQQAAEILALLLPPDFYGKVVLTFEAGRCPRVEVNQSFKL